MKDGYLSHDDMKKVIEDGGTVLHNGQFYSKASDLPSAGSIAISSGDSEGAATSLEDIAAKRAALDAEEERLKTALSAPADDADAKAKADADAKAKADAEAKAKAEADAKAKK